MKRFVLCAQVLILCLSVTPLNAQSQWKWLYPKPQGNTLNDVDVMLPTTAIAVGALGSVIRTTDQGLTWVALPTITGMPDLRGVSFVTTTTVVVVGVGGVILRSIDGGVTWNARASGTTSDLQAVDFVDGWQGMAAGSNGIILRSDDAGNTWAAQTSGTLETLSGIRMTGASTATVVGSGGTILGTTDGGANWVPRTSGTTANLLDVDFYGTNAGMAVGPGTTVLITVDGGANWSRPATPVPIQWSIAANAVDVTGFPHAVVVGALEGADFAAMIHTDDGGVSWSASYEVLSSPLAGVAMFTSSQGVSIGGGGTIRRTTDGGVSWPQIAGAVGIFSMQDVEFFDALHGAAISKDTYSTAFQIHSTTDGGATWSVGRLNPNLINEVSDVAFADANTIYLVGHGMWWVDEGARIIRNGVEIYSSSCWPDRPTCISNLLAVDFAGPDAGVAVGIGASVVTILGGVATEVSLPMGASLNGVSVPTPQTAYAVGNNGVIFKGDLMSESWVALTSGTSTNLLDVCFTDDMTGTVVGESGTILRTIDGGDSWVPQSSGTTGALTRVSFIDASNGLIGTEGTTVLRTADGGATWFPEEVPITLADIDFIDPAHMVAVGGAESIIARFPASVAGACPADMIIPGYSTVPSVSLVGFRITNTGTAPASFIYGLTSNGPATLVDKGNPLALSGMSPVLAPGASYYPPEAGLVIPDIRTYMTQRVTYMIEGGVFSCETAIAFEPPVPVLIGNLDATAFNGGVRLKWDVFSDEVVVGFRIYRGLKGRSVTEITSAGLIPPDVRTYADEGVRGGKTYQYTLAAVLADGSEVPSPIVTVKAIPYALVLDQNVPNPFNPTTTISFTLPERASVTLAIYDVEGRQVRTLVNESTGEGRHEYVWDGRNANGSPVSSGLYFYRLTAGKQTLTRKMVLLK